AVSMVLLSTLTTTTALWVVCSYIAVMGLGLGMTMQILVLVVQNSFPIGEVGTATAGNNFFRQVGSSLGTAVVGSLFVSRLTGLLTQRLGADAAGTDLNSLTPAVLQQLPPAVHDVVVTAYNDALTPVFLYLTPLAVISVVLLLFVQEKPLAT